MPARDASETDTTAIAQRLAAIDRELPPTVRLIAVSKNTSIDAIRAAYAAGMRDFAESRVQEALVKQEALRDLQDITWHFIGTLQANKARAAVRAFAWIHSVDRLSLAQRLDRAIAAEGISPRLCLQVKLAPDPNKGGWTREQLLAELPELAACSHLAIEGLMTILPLGLSAEEALATFERTRQLRDELQSRGWTHIAHLSMGMSGDYALAVKAGATMVRVGSKIFGGRA